jgi:hypothetical protein
MVYKDTVHHILCFSIIWERKVQNPECEICMPEQRVYAALKQCAGTRGYIKTRKFVLFSSGNY